MFISSDTNIWIDFFEINHLDHPFRLEYKYYINRQAYDDELLEPNELRLDLARRGLQLTELEPEEFSLAMEYRTKYRALTIYDAFALSIAKSRNWILLTGDKPLRNAAVRENVECHGVIWVYDELQIKGKMTQYEYQAALRALITAVENGHCRLPLEELRKRLSSNL